MLLQTLAAEMPKLTVGMIYCAMLNLYEGEKAQMNDHWKHIQVDEKGQLLDPSYKAGTLTNFILSLVAHLYDIKQFVYNLPHYFQILGRFASLGPEARELLLKAKVVGRCMDFFFDHQSPYRSIFADMTDLGPVSFEQDPEIGLPTAVNKKVRTYFQIIQEKRRKQQLQSATPKYKFLMELVSLCVRHMKIGVK
jgi:hypothetical protein